MWRGPDDEGSRREIMESEETRKEMEVVEAMKKQLRLRGELDHLG